MWILNLLFCVFNLKHKLRNWEGALGGGTIRKGDGSSWVDESQAGGWRLKDLSGEGNGRMEGTRGRPTKGKMHE